MAEVVVSAMVEGVVSFGMEKLWDLLSRESERLQGVHEHVDDLKRRMRKLQSLLKDADAKKHKNDAVRNFLEDVKDIVYDAEDIIESFLLKESSGNEKWIKRRVKGLSCFLVERRDISIEIEGITKRMSEVVAEMQSFGIKEIMYDGRSLSLKERQRVQREIRQTFPKSSEKGLVGVEESVEELVGHLVKNDNIQVVSISGMGGIGKTTLARQVFHHDIVRRHFDGFAWVCVSKEFRRKDIWQKILQDLRPHGKDIKQMDENEVQAIKQMDENELQEKLFPLLGARRHLIVLDDVWQNEDWDRIKDVFPQERGWKMILTSRNGGVGLHADPTCFAFTPTILTPEESWELCEQIALSRRDKTEFSVDKELEAMGKKMVKYCGGLPLAVKVLGGLLANKKYTVEAWKRVYDNIQTQIIRSDDNKQDSVYRVLSLSYEDLPMHLKHCFLCLAYFPEDYKITVNRLSYLWAAEGIITSSCDGPTIRESGEEYMEELGRRNMVIVEKSIGSWGQEYCQMHDMMREVCLSKAKEENFVQVIKAPTSTSTVNAHTRESRRLVLHGGNALNMWGGKSNKKARSVLGFGLDSNLWKQSAQGFRNLQLLRVLDLNLQSDSVAAIEVGRIPSSIGNLIHLRYLSLNVTSGSHLPSSLRNLKLLLYLELSSSGKVYVPNIFKEMVELRFLWLPFYMKNKTKLELGNLVNLELLGCFRSKSGSIIDLCGMTRLRTLEVVLEGKYTCEILASSLRELRNLEKLSLISLSESDVAPDVDFIWNFIHLRDLVMSMHMPRLPEHSRFPPNLASISLGQCRMEEDPLPILEKLLHLKSVILFFDAFAGRKMVCSKGGFPQLHKLDLVVLKELEEWEIEEGSMPCLRTLHIKYCDKLKEIPEGLKYIISLKELKISGMNNEWKGKLESGGESYYKVQHIPSVQLNYPSYK
ncbi:probable disease resistance RPP8-like protein 2 [Brassica napus]|uniref:probable disease resistance RPP8-like protein 2 n=1 Tax=Brassica napus TaxID=3708 RepID=UPI0020785D30|nr:probable disease resistance RPP8-like protein 2 [Brassica napus]XP_048591205.1 probable disease resistance RPP8-like protein 2 [Brassica napus]XP_048591206.1 probable disease resistance RPP8-like protein 2 [Brassica napus]XP_048591207.1 probable disease resistance RPP8-like protein 2 [Brassica napus]XP_048591208.1 probable disease resistance RPP8-like protein 2 [Brassica napus]XP_048591209.1 probable disease resistance RPP8-like protein 2 [Brassica napus]XP_048591210.1 probable disease res